MKKILVNIFLCFLLMPCGILAASVAHHIGDRYQFLAIALKGAPMKKGDIDFLKSFTNNCDFLEVKNQSLDTINALGLLVRRAGLDLKFQDHCLDVLQGRIGIDVDAEGYAELADNLSQQRDQAQAYGSFGSMEHGHFLPPADRHVNAYRSFIGLLPVAQRDSMLEAALGKGEWDGLGHQDLAMKASHYPLFPKLRHTLMDMALADQRVRSDHWREFAHMSSQAAAMNHIDVVNLRRLLRIFRQYGIPDATHIGRNGVQDYFLLVQHAAGDQAFMASTQSRFKELYEAGDLPPVSWALLTDRLRVLNHQNQLYGSQSGADAHGWFMFPVEAPDDLNKRRAVIGLAPLDLSKLPPQRWPQDNGGK